ncbi:MAG: hypothetical protein ACR2GN_03375 [Bacteroidia bacterium]
MKKKSKEENKDPNANLKRRLFLKRFGMGVVLASSYSVISLTQFGCVHDSNDEATPKGGY